MTDFAQARRHMVDSQIRTMGVIDERIIEAFTQIPREIFISESLQHIACIDEDLEYADRHFLMEPSVHARLLDAASITKNDLVLDVGCGSGYSTSILSNLAATVVALDNNEKLFTQALKNWKNLGLCNVVPEQGSLKEGVEKHAPYDVIIINGSIKNIPDCFFAQLANNGKILAVIKDDQAPLGTASLIQKCANGEISCIELFDAGTKSLKEFSKKPEFSF
tara:strand:- start:1351 stop:2013 length:663 start_codon:yes stop_codon:yes gene_type:complete